MRGLLDAKRKSRNRCASMVPTQGPVRVLRKLAETPHHGCKAMALLDEEEQRAD